MTNEKSKHVKIFTGNIIQINHIQSELESKNIPFIIKNNFESALMAGFSTGQDDIELYVFDQDLEKANKIINHIKNI